MCVRRMSHTEQKEREREREREREHVPFAFNRLSEALSKSARERGERRATSAQGEMIEIERRGAAV